MKRALFLSLLASSLVVTALITGCDWSTNDAGFNTSEGAGVSINFSGYYHSTEGGRLVKNTSAGNIVSLTIQQAGNSVEVHDNQGSTYRGTIGAPGSVSSSSSGSYPSGAQLAQAQINFSGHDNVSAKDITFAGIIHAVAVTDIKGTTETDTSTDTRTRTETVTTNVTIGSTGQEVVTTVTTTEYDANGNETYKRISTTKTTPDGTVISHNVSETGTRTDTSTDTATTTYTITEANSQYRLQGTWVEQAGKVSEVDGISAGNSGTISTTTSTTTAQ